jgi:hypothetical protein
MSRTIPARHPRRPNRAIDCSLPPVNGSGPGGCGVEGLIDGRGDVVVATADDVLTDVVVVPDTDGTGDDVVAGGVVVTTALVVVTAVVATGGVVDALDVDVDGDVVVGGVVLVGGVPVSEGDVVTLDVDVAGGLVEPDVVTAGVVGGEVAMELVVTGGVVGGVVGGEHGTLSSVHGRPSLPAIVQMKAGSYGWPEPVSVAGTARSATLHAAYRSDCPQTRGGAAKGYVPGAWTVTSLYPTSRCGHWPQAVVNAKEAARTTNGWHKGSAPATVTVPAAVTGSSVYVTAAATADMSDVGMQATATAARCALTAARATGVTTKRPTAMDAIAAPTTVATAFPSDVDLMQLIPSS